MSPANSDADKSAAAGGLDERSRPSGESHQRRRPRNSADAEGDEPPCAITVPAIHDLANRLRFAPSHGRIWLDDQRMMLMHVTSLGALAAGTDRESRQGDRARPHHPRSAIRPARATRKWRRSCAPSSSAMDHFLAGPQLVSLEGIVHCEPLALEIDVGSGRYFGDFCPDRLRRGGGASRELRRRRRADLLDAGRLRLRLHLDLHGPPDPVARDRVPRHGARPLPRRRPSGRGMGRSTRATTCGSCRSAIS